MNASVAWVSARSATVVLDDDGLFETRYAYRLELNGEMIGEAHTVVHSIFSLLPNTEYTLDVLHDSASLASLRFRTHSEDYSLNVRAFGAFGDGEHDDTAAIQAAIACCTPNSRVVLPAGRYLARSLFLKSHITVELQRGATLLLTTDRSSVPTLPGLLESWDEQSELSLASWEGNPLSSYASLLTGVAVEDVRLIGEGEIDGQAQLGDWWVDCKRKRGAWRSRLLFLNRCKDMTVQGLIFRNSPSWHIHPYFSSDISFYNITVEAPPDSPNTDGLNPESCSNVSIAGARFSLGDDCIAVKSGKRYMGRTLHTPCERISIEHCLMENGHSGVTIGSEMSGGVRDVSIHHCLMRNTDRGLRVKTRRGRGGRIDDVRMENVRMERVNAPLTVNCHYFCDPDGHSDRVQNRAAQPVDDATPSIGALSVRHVEAVDCGACACYLLGIQEQPIEKVELENSSFCFARECKPMQPIMADGVEPCIRKGVVAENVRSLRLRSVSLTDCDGERISAFNVDEVREERA